MTDLTHIPTDHLLHLQWLYSQGAVYLTYHKLHDAKDHAEILSYLEMVNAKVAAAIDEEIERRGRST